MKPSNHCTRCCRPIDGDVVVIRGEDRHPTTKCTGFSQAALDRLKPKEKSA